MSTEHKDVIYAFVQLFTKDLDQQLIKTGAISRCPFCGKQAVAVFFSDMILKESKRKYFWSGFLYHQDDAERSYLKNQCLLSELSLS